MERINTAPISNIRKMKLKQNNAHNCAELTNQCATFPCTMDIRHSTYKHSFFWWL